MGLLGLAAGLTMLQQIGRLVHLLHRRGQGQVQDLGAGRFLCHACRLALQQPLVAGQVQEAGGLGAGETAVEPDFLLDPPRLVQGLLLPIAEASQ